MATVIAPLLSFLLSCDHRQLHSFPTRRSSDLVFEKLKAQNPNATRQQARAAAARDWNADFFKDDNPTFQSRADRKSTRLNSSHSQISYAVFCLKKKNKNQNERMPVTTTTFACI